MSFKSNPASPATLAVRAALESDQQHGAVVPPLHLSTNFTFRGFGDKRQYDYTRSGNPTRDALSEALSTLEGGAGAVVTSSGMAALTLLLQLLKPGDLLIAPHDCYGGSYRLFESLSARGHFELRFVDQSSRHGLDEILALKPTLILAETPSNPLLRITDIEALSKVAKTVGALLAVDNTFLSPVLQTPISLGADLVVHSTTKYLNGHSDIVGGAVVAATGELAEELDGWANCLGISGSPFDSYLTLRGIRTIHARIRQHQENAAELADLLDGHPAVRCVWYPGLKSHPGHQIAARQQKGFGGMVSFEIEGGEAAVRAFVENLQHFSLAESLGGVESLVCHPATMTHAPMSDAALAEAGISQSLIRLSVGIEDATDLCQDVRRALNIALTASQITAVVAG
jgi:cystathionine gamma-synthase